ncbi:MAG TPA: hypothetical protein VFU17_01205 [Candidatus Limnocylindrales bacterium]|nr:hypothetical protein [Candidatus Limnocylindrales bacterium]
MMRLALVAGALLVAFAIPAPTFACSPPFNPTIEELGPDQVVVVGTIGEPVDGGRHFHVERAFNSPMTTPIVIAFKDGEPVGDCSYPVHAGERLTIAPIMGVGGRLSADMGTLQADPATAAGQRYLAEAERLFGPGSIPGQAEPVQEGVSSVAVVALALGVLVAVTLVVAVRRSRTG